MPSLIRTKSGIFYIVSTVNGKRVWRTTRTRKRTVAYQQFLLAATSTPNSVVERGEKTLSEAVENFLASVRVNLAPKTHEVYKHSLAHLRAFVGDDRPVGSITSWDIDQYKIQRAALVRPTTVNIELRSVKSFFNALRRWEMVPKNPCDGVALVRIPEAPPCYIPKDQIPALLGAFREAWLREIVTFAVMTGARLGEILNLRWEDVDLKNRTAFIRSGPSYRVKGGKMRILPLNETVIEMLSRRAIREGVVFKGKRGQRANPDFVSRKFRETVRPLGFDRRIHFHSLRHTFASLLVGSGVSLYKVQKLLGHSSPRVTEVYSHLQHSEMHDVVRVLVLTPG